MATEKKITSRIQQKHDVAANWAKATNFIPKKGELIIYDAEYNASGEETQAVRFKIGDGSKTVGALPFAVIDYSSDIETLEQEVADNSTAIGTLQGAFESDGTTVKKATSAETADKVANGLTIASATFDGSKALKIVAGHHLEITGGNAASSNVNIDMTYSGVMPSTYNKVTVDGYGIVTGGENVDYAKKTDLPDISGLMPKSGGTFTGNITVPKTITFTDETNPFIKMRTGNTDFYFQSTSGQFGLGPTWDKATHWDSNGNVTFPTTPKVGSSSLALKSDIPSAPTNYVTTDTDQTVGGAKSFTNISAPNGIKIGDNNTVYGAGDSEAVTQFLPAKDGTFAMTSDIPVTYDELTRIQKQAYTGGDNTVQYFKLASFPVYNSGGNYASFIITGRMGGWQADNMSFVNMILYNRNGEGGGYINVANSAFFNLCDIVMYREADGTSTAYLKVKSYYTFDINVNTYQATNVYTGTDDTPTGTLKWTASEQADRLAVSGGVAYVNGFTLPKQVQINGTTVNPNSAGLINLGTGFAKTADLPIKSASLDGTTLYLTL